MSPWCEVILYVPLFVRTVGLYTATGGAEFGPPPLGGPRGPPRTLCHAPAPLTRRWSSSFVVLQFRCRRVIGAKKTYYKKSLIIPLLQGAQ